MTSSEKEGKDRKIESKKERKDRME
jgi:hypothetical protein